MGQIRHSRGEDSCFTAHETLRMGYLLFTIRSSIVTPIQLRDYHTIAQVACQVTFRSWGHFYQMRIDRDNILPDMDLQDIRRNSTPASARRPKSRRHRLANCVPVPSVALHEPEYDAGRRLLRRFASRNDVRGYIPAAGRQPSLSRHQPICGERNQSISSRISAACWTRWGQMVRKRPSRVARWMPAGVLMSQPSSSLQTTEWSRCWNFVANSRMAA